MKINLLLATIVLVVLLSSVAAPAAADTIYMKNGRVITSSSVRVDGDHVYVRLLGGEVRLPLFLIDRIVVDDAIEAPPSVVPGQESTPDPNNPTGPVAPGDPAGQGDSAAEAATEEPEPAPEETRAYWRNRLDPLQEELAGMDGDIQRLRSRTGAEVEAQIQRLQATRDGVQARLNAILREARRLGVPPGWLR